MIGEKRTSVSHDLPHPGSGGKTRSLIKRKDILEQIKMGNRLLEEYEEQKQKDEEMTKTLGEYTMLDLQSHILDLTVSCNLSVNTVSHFSYAPLIKCKIIQKRNRIFLI